MAFFKNILRFVGWTIGILLLLCVVFAVAWWAQWSLPTVTLALCAMVALALLFWIGRKIYLWYNKRRYVRNVLTQDPSKQVQEDATNAMQRAWQEGFDKHSRLGRRSQQLPWAVFLEHSTHDTAQLLQVFRQNTQERLVPQNTILQWYALPELLILRPDVKYTQQALLQADNQEEWEEFLVNMVKAHKKKSLNALILTVSTKLLQGDTQALQNYARALRARVHEIESLSKHPVPIYILVTGIEILPGLATLVAHMSEERRARALGCDFRQQQAETSASYVQKSLSKASLALRKELVQQAATQGVKPCGDMYAAPKSLEVLEGNLSIFMDCLLLGLPSTEQVLVRGLYYSYALPRISMINDTSAWVYTTPVGSMPNNAAPLATAQGASTTVNEQSPPPPLNSGNGLPQGQGANSSQNFLAFGAVQPIVQSEAFASPATMGVDTASAQMASPFANTSSTNPSSAAPSSTDPSSTNLSSTSASSTASPLTAPKRSFVLPQRAEGLAFVEEVFLRIVPRDAYAYKDIQRPLYREKLVFPCLVAWFFALFALCGGIAASVIHNNQNLQNIYAIKAPPTNAPDSAHLQWLQERLQAFDKAQQHWWLPSLGLDRLHRERQQAVVDYKAAMEQKVVPAVIQDLLRNVMAKEQQTPAYEAARCLLWMQEALVQRISKGNTEAIRASVFPAAPQKNYQGTGDVFASSTGANDTKASAGSAALPTTKVVGTQTATLPISTYKPQPSGQAGQTGQAGLSEEAFVWSPTFGELFLSYLDVVNKEQLAPLQEHVSTALDTIFAGSSTQLFAYLEDSVNTKLAREAVGLSLYWPNVPAGTQGFTAVSPIYTKAGYESLALQMGALLGDKSLADQPFWKSYEQRYATAWSNFIVQSDAAWVDITQVSTLYSMGRVKTIFDDPYIRLVMKAAEALAPLQNSTVAPAWLEDIFLMQALLDVTRLASDTQPDSLFAIPNTISSIFRSSTTSVHVIKNHLRKTRDIGGLLDAVQDLRNYEAALQDLRTTLNSEEGCFELAKVEYGGKAYGKPEESRMAEANTTLRMAFEHLHTEFGSQRNSHSDVDWGSDSPVVFAMRGPLRFMAHAIACTAALTLQKQWEADVLAPAAVVPQETYLQALVGEKGLLQAFITEKAAAFLQRTVGKYEARSWMHVAFPFTQDFLHFIQEGQVASMQLPKESYVVSLISQTSDINDEAKERLQYFEISMPSSKGDLLLRNNNYPVRKNLTYLPAEPSPVRLILSFPSLKLSHEYASFTDFLQDFAYGERIFTQDDFPDEAEKLRSLGIEEITIRVLPENAAEILAANDTNLPPIPERITKVW